MTARYVRVTVRVEPLAKIELLGITTTVIQTALPGTALDIARALAEWVARYPSGRVILPVGGWQHVGCPECGVVTVWPERLVEEGLPLCVHDGGSVVPPRPHSSERWTEMVKVSVVAAS